MNLIPPPDFSDPREIALTNQDTLRIVVGLLRMLLPLFLYLFLLIDTGFAKPMPSISHYYLTRSSGIFVIVVSLLAIFLIIYKGKEKIDFYLSVMAGIFALLLLLFPTNDLPADFKCNDCIITNLKDSAFRPAFHLISAAAFLFTLALMALFLFTRSDKSIEKRGKPKRRRNRIFRTCGTIIIIALLVMFAGLKLDLF